MARIEKRLPKEELVALIEKYKEGKKKNPQRIDRHLTYKIYNNLYNDKQRDVNACTCHDRATDQSVVRYVERYHADDEPLPIQPSVKIELDGFTKPVEKVKKPRKKRVTKNKPKKGDV